MPRRLRIQYRGALYHVINRGNFRQAVFSARGAAHAFEYTLAEAVRRYRWRVHAYVVLSNHFHLALETPEPNLSEGMHWLLSSYCSRHNRFRGRHGHLFQGRYKALLVEDEAYLNRVSDYIHLNPVRARLAKPRRLGEYRWSSLWWRCRGAAPVWLLPTSESVQSSEDRILSRLIDLAVTGGDDDRMRAGGYSNGWAMGTSGWQKALAKEYAHMRLCAGMERDELQQLKQTRWNHELEAGLTAAGKSLRDAERESKGAAWKIVLAQYLRATADAPHRWIAETLYMGAASSVRAYLAGSSD